jgi:DNA-directed RNA polymerase subunit K/omega
MKDQTQSGAGLSNENTRAAVGNMYMIPVLAATRYRELKQGHPKRVITNSGPKVTALEELEAGCFEFQKFTGKYATK